MYAAGRVFVASAALCVALGLAGCGSSNSASGGSGGGGVTGGTPLVTGGGKDIYVMQREPSSDVAQSILDFAADSNGSLTPKGTLLPPAGAQIYSIATDSAGQIYLGGSAIDSNGYSLAQVFVYAPGATGQATPLRKINLIDDIQDTDYFYLPFEMAVDSSGRLYVVGVGVIGTFPANANGDTPAITTVLYPEEQVSVDSSEIGPMGVAVDGSGNIYLASYLPGIDQPGYIYEYSAGASGNATPLRAIQTQGIPYGLALDASGNIYTSLDTLTLNSTGGITASANQIVEYGGPAGSPVIVKTIAGAATGLAFGSGPQIDQAGNLYLVSVVTSGTGTDATYTNNVVGFAPTATGNVEPGIVFSSSSWTNAGLQMALH